MCVCVCKCECIRELMECEIFAPPAQLHRTPLMCFAVFLICAPLWAMMRLSIAIFIFIWDEKGIAMILKFGDAPIRSPPQTPRIENDSQICCLLCTKMQRLSRKSIPYKYIDVNYAIDATVGIRLGTWYTFHSFVSRANFSSFSSICFWDWLAGIFASSRWWW